MNDEIKAKIKDWLKDEGGYSEGLALFMSASRNMHLASHLQRRRDEKKLCYELDKLVGGGLKPFDRNRLAKASESKTDRKTIPAAAQDVKIPPLDEKPNETLKVLRPGGIRFEDMPEPIKAIYLQVCETRNKMRSLHEKMKLVATDAERAELRAELVALEEQRAAGWAAIDAWAKDGTLPDSEVQKPAESVSDTPPSAKSVNSARASVTRNLALLAKAEDPARVTELIERLREAVVVIQASGGGFGKNTELLAKHGLI